MTYRKTCILHSTAAGVIRCWEIKFPVEVWFGCFCDISWSLVGTIFISPLLLDLLKEKEVGDNHKLKMMTKDCGDWDLM
jgi:hypothetical protein